MNPDQDTRTDILHTHVSTFIRSITVIMITITIRMANMAEAGKVRILQITRVVPKINL